MAECTNCGAYTKYQGGLCYKCFQNKDDKEVLVTEKPKKEIESKSENNSNNKENYWVDSVIKGRIAETLIEELFRSLGFQVFKYGMENTIPGIRELLKGVKDEVATEIRRMPDLVVFKDGRAHFIEVKFRANGAFKLSDLPTGYPYHNALFVLVSKKHIKCISFEELVEGKEINPKSQNYLGKRKEFDTDSSKIIQFCTHAVKYFENV